MKILITGANGFIGRNLATHLEQDEHYQLFRFTREQTREQLDEWLGQVDVIFHLAGVNRPQKESEFQVDNVDLTAYICDRLLAIERSIPLVLSSSTQAELNNPYGVSKQKAEGIVKKYAKESKARVAIYRLTNVFGKWSRPHYNSVVATFCYQIARDLPIQISNQDHQLELVHIDDVITSFVSELEKPIYGDASYEEAGPKHPVTLGQLADLLLSFRQMRKSLLVPDFSDAFTHKLYGTYLSYLETDDFAYKLAQRCDPRGCLAEFVKSSPFGQIFVSRTVPGITRGNHYHHLKTEKFLVLEGEAIIRFRHIESDEIIEYPVRGEEFKVVDIPPGYTHSIENIGQSELVTLFWASEIFDPERTDTVYEAV